MFETQIAYCFKCGIVDLDEDIPDICSKCCEEMETEIKQLELEIKGLIGQSDSSDQ